MCGIVNCFGQANNIRPSLGRLSLLLYHNPDFFLRLNIPTSHQKNTLVFSVNGQALRCPVLILARLTVLDKLLPRKPFNFWEKGENYVV